MKPFSAISSSIALIAGTLMIGSAQAEYRCYEPVRIHKEACKAAEQGSTELRRFIQRARWIESLRFEDYVTEATWAVWDRKEAALSAATQVASGSAAVKPALER